MFNNLKKCVQMDTCVELQVVVVSADAIEEECECLPAHPKLLPWCTVLVIDSLVKWSVSLWKGKEKGNGKRESRWKTTCHILQKWLMVQKESHLQWMNIETHKPEINKMLWLQCCFLFPGFLCFFLQSLTSPPSLRHTVILHLLFFPESTWLVFIIFTFFMYTPYWYSSLSTCSASGLFFCLFFW